MMIRRALRSLARPAFLVLACALAGGPAACEDPPRTDAPSVERLAVFPRTVRFSRPDALQSFVIVAVSSDGTTRDVTSECDVRFATPHIVARSNNALRPLNPGETTLDVRYGGRRVRVPVVVEPKRAATAPNFLHDVMPIFMRAGCNAGGCHGAARGKDGFHLSLFGYDPNGDHHRLTRELAGRRINFAAPRESLLLTKATGGVPHSGGRRFGPDDPAYRVLERWIRGGAPATPKKTPTLDRVVLAPGELVFARAGESHQMLVTARYSDGTQRDVTALAVFMSSDDHTAKFSGDGRLTAMKGGEAFVMARFGAHTVGSHVIVRRKNDRFAWPASEPHADDAALGPIDRAVARKLEKLRMAPSPLADDATFLRRATLDLAGRLPTVAELKTFVSDQTPTKRRQVVDRLIDSPEFAALWTLKWAELLQIRSNGNRISKKTAVVYYDWLKDEVTSGTPVDRMVRALISASGSTFENPAATYYQAERDPLKLAENAAQVFLGMRIQCAQCHNHPFDRWTQNDYYGFAAFFAQIARKRGADPREWVIFDRRRGDVRHPVTKKNAVPKFLGGTQPSVKNADRREVVARWITSRDNPYFARNIANIVWAHFFGRGIVDEVDDVRVSNPPSNAALLDALAERLVEHDFDLRELARDICTSRTYQRSTRPTPSNRDDRANFARALPRRIKAEVLLDCIGQVTRTTEKFRGLPRGSRAVEIGDGATTTHFLTIFGRPKRETVCSCEVEMEPNLSQALHLINGSTVTRNIKRGRLVSERLKQKRSPATIIEEIYLRALSRRPTAAESTAFDKTLAAAKKKGQALEDVFWAVLNSKEFIFNH